MTDTRGRAATANGAVTDDALVADTTLALRRAIEGGQPWQEALLQAMEQWTMPEEVHAGVRRRYLLLGEAFDWLLLARRLATSVGELIPEDEQRGLLRRCSPASPQRVFHDPLPKRPQCQDLAAAHDR